MPARPCLTQGCPEVVQDGGSRCARHRTTGWASYRPPWRDLYQTSAWRRRRAEQLRAHPQCVVCGRPASHVDHIVGMAAGGDFDDGALQSQCVSCHRKKSALEGGRGRKERQA